MGNFIDCWEKLDAARAAAPDAKWANAVNARDREAILERAKEYQATGMAPDAAHVAAVEWMIDQTNTEIAGVEEQAGGTQEEGILASAPLMDPANLGTWAESPLRAIGMPEDAMNRGTVALARWTGQQVAKGVDALGISSTVQKMANTGPGKMLDQALRLAQREFVPRTLLVREAAAKIQETRSQIAWSGRIGEDLYNVLKKGGNAKFTEGYTVPDALLSPDHQREMSRYFRGDIPIDDVPPELHEWARAQTKMWDDRGKQMVDEGIMRWETYAARRAGDNRYFPHMYVKEELESQGFKWVNKAIGKMFLDRIRPQLSTAWYIYHKNPSTGEMVKNKDGDPKLVEHKEKTWRFKSVEHRDMWFEDFVRSEIVAQMRGRGLDFDSRDLDALELQSDEVAALVSVAEGEVRARYGMGSPTDLESLERGGLITNMAYVVPKSIMQMDHDIAMAKLFNWFAEQESLVSDGPTAGFKQIPNDRRWGRLAGKYVDEAHWNELIEMREPPNIALEVYDAALGKWKFWKTVMNLATHFRNIFGNFFFADVAGVGIHGIQAFANAVYYRDAWRAIRGESKDVTLEELYSSGVLGGDFITAEINEMLKTLPFENTDGTPKHPANALWSALWKMAGKVTGGAKALYELEDAVPKVAAYIKARRSGMSTPEAAQHVRRWFPYYDQVGKSSTIRFAKRLSSPFLSFMQEAIRIGIEASKHKPITFAKWMAVPSLLSALSRHALGLDDDDWEAVQRDMRGKAFGYPMFSAILPILDENGRLIQWDFSNVIPYADMLGERMGAADEMPWWQQMVHKHLAGGPAPQTIQAVMGTNPFTQKKFRQTDMTNSEVALETGRYLGGLWLPPLTPVVGTADPITTMTRPEVVGPSLVPRSKASELSRKLFGVDIRPAVPDLRKSADAFRKARGLPAAPEFNDSTAKSRSRREVYSALVNGDVDKLAESLVELRNRTGESLRTPQDVNRLFYYRNPSMAIQRKDDREAWIRSLTQVEKKELDRATADFEKAKRNAMTMIRQAEAKRPELAVPLRKPLTTQ